MSERKPLPGKFVWFELATSDPKRAQAFYGEVLGWSAVGFPAGGTTYDMIFAGETPDTMVGGYVPLGSDAETSRWIANVSVDDVDKAVAAAVTHGGKVLLPPHPVMGVGRTATIIDPQGAELALFKHATGDPPDVTFAPTGRFIWNELHTTNPEQAAAFYEKVVGFTHRSLPTPGGPYHILSKDGVDRGGITGHLPPGVTPHWLPFVHVDDVDAATERARRHGAEIPISPMNVGDIGRIAVLRDPTGALLALMKPNPRANT